MEDSEEVGGMMKEVAEVVSESDELANGVEDENENNVVLVEDSREAADEEDLINGVEGGNENNVFIEDAREVADEGDLINGVAEEMERGQSVDDNGPEISSFASDDASVEKVQEVDFPLAEEKDVTVIYWDEELEATTEGVTPNEDHIAEDASSLIPGEQMAAVAEKDPMEGEDFHDKTRTDIDLNFEEMKEHQDPILQELDILEQKDNIDFVPSVEESRSEIVEPRTLNPDKEALKNFEEADLARISMANGTTEILTDEPLDEIKEDEVITDTPDLMKEEKAQNSVEGEFEKETGTVNFPLEEVQMSTVADEAEQKLPIVTDDEILQSSKGADGSEKALSNCVFSSKANGTSEETKSIPIKNEENVSVASSDANANVSLVSRQTVSPVSWLSCCGLFDVLQTK